AGRTPAARRRGRGHDRVAFAYMADPAADGGDVARTLVSEWPKWNLGVSPAICLQIGAAGERGADAQQHFAGSGYWDGTGDQLYAPGFEEAGVPRDGRGSGGRGRGCTAAGHRDVGA